MKSNTKKMKTEIFYNGSCSICAPEIRMYKKIITNENVEGSNQLDFVDISVSVPDEFSQEDMLKRLHAKLPNGDIVSGVPAFIALWKQVPGFKGLAFLINLPIIKSVIGGGRGRPKGSLNKPKDGLLPGVPKKPKIFSNWLECKHCEYKCRKRKPLQNHMLEEHNVIIYLCEHCDEMFKDKSELQKHKLLLCSRLKKLALL